jgi:DNA-directed RNA polymerase specialized sigma24 family protein
MNTSMPITQTTEVDYNFYTLLCEVLTGRKPIDAVLEHEEFQHRAKQCCHAIARKWEEGEDLFQDACIRVWKYGSALKPENIKNKDAFFAWFYVLALHTYMGNWRKQRIQFDSKPVQEMPVADPRVNIEAQCLLSEFLEFCQKTLPDNRHRAVKYWLEGYSFRDIAGNLNETGTPGSHVAVRTWVRDTVKGFLKRASTPGKKAIGY